jgi:3-oxoacyl-[acyl-carrier-protein] synthase-3
MNFHFTNKKISGIITILPGNEVTFEDEMGNYNFSEAKSLKLKAAMGFNKKRIVKPGVTSSDLCLHGLNYLIDHNLLQKDDIDALILVTQSPDYIMPPTSNVIQGALGLKSDVLCMDINQGCAGYIVGLMQGFMLLDQPEIKKVVLMNSDVLSPKVSKRDRNSNPLIGDAASISILERSNIFTSIACTIKMNGQGAFALQIPAGGTKLPNSTETSKMIDDANGNFRSKDHLVMKGDEVFNFVQTEVPPLIDEVFKSAKITKEEIDYFIFHQPNRFMLQKLADKIGVSRDKMPNNIVENFGNSSGVTIPLAITFNFGNEFVNKFYKLCLSGFGVGLTWAAMVIDVGPLEFCEQIEY